MRYLSFDLSEGAEGADGVTTLEALASTSAAEHGAVMAEVQQVLGWAWQHFAHTHGPVDEGMDWHHDLQVQVEEGGQWHAVTLTLVGSPQFLAAFVSAWGDSLA